jgi:hypothetical protein
MNMNNHLTSQLAAERQRDLRATGPSRANATDAPAWRGPRLARSRVPRSAAAWRARFRHGRSA